jgi:anaerobic ribonucleoside-triphosphate reductase activating protein
MADLSLHSILSQSEVNGPGERLVIWSQGCTKGCFRCFNPETWKFSSKWMVSSEDLVARVVSSNPDGITLTGGDPLEQPEALLKFLRLLHDNKSGEDLRADFLPKGIICFTGFVIEELSGAALECLEYIDLLIDGRYVEQLRYTSGLAGSSNQRFHFSSIPGRGESRLKRSEILIDQAVEVHIDDVYPDIIKVTGFPSIDRSFLKKHGLLIESEK